VLGHNIHACTPHDPARLLMYQWVMTTRRPLAVLSLAVAIGGPSPNARAAQVEGHVETGVLVPEGFSSFAMRPTLGGDVTKVWSPLRYLGLGLEAGIDGTSLPYAQSDEPAKLGGMDNLTEGVTLRPRLMFGPRFVPAPAASVAVSVGSTWLWYRAGANLAIIPYPTVSGALQLKLGPDGRYGVRVGASYMHVWFGHDKALLGTTLAFVWSR
jgi:hypothetical protein